MRRRTVFGGLLVALLVAAATPVSAGSSVEAVVVLHGELPGDVSCRILKRSAASPSDRNPGSVVRGLTETVAHDAAMLWAQLRKEYESDFLGTASGTVSAGILDGGKLNIAQQWELEIKAVSGKPNVQATMVEQPLPVPSLSDCA